MKIKKILICGFFLFLPLLYGGAVYVHSSLGNDTNSGSVLHPLATIEKALSYMDGSTISTCRVSGIFLHETVSVTNTAGTPEVPLVITVWSDQNPFILRQSLQSAFVFTNDNVHNIILKHIIIDGITNTPQNAVLINAEVSNIIFLSNWVFNNGASTSHGFDIKRGRNIFVYSTVISNFYNNILFDGEAVANTVFSNVKILEAAQEGVYFYASGASSGHTNIRIQDCLIRKSVNYGLRTYLSVLNSIIIENNIFLSNGNAGMVIQDDFYEMTLRHNTVIGNQHKGFDIRGTGHSACFITGNWFRNHDEDGILIYATVTNLSVQSNVFLNNTLNGFHIDNAPNSTFSGIFCNNIFIHDGYGIYIKSAIPDLIIKNNTFKMSGGTAAVYVSTSNPVECLNNIIVGPASSGIYQDSSICSNAYNNITNVTTPYSGCSAGIGALSADPDFAETNILFWKERNFYALLPSSPCIDAGDPSDSVPEGAGLRIDMGAKEYISSHIPDVHTNIALLPPIKINDGIRFFQLYNDSPFDNKAACNLDIIVQFALTGTLDSRQDVFVLYHTDSPPSSNSMKIQAVFTGSNWEAVFPAGIISVGRVLYLKFLTGNMIIENPENISGSWGFTAEEIQDQEASFSILHNALDCCSGEKVFFKYRLLKTQSVQIFIYDLKGHMVKKVVHTSESSGEYLKFWDGKNNKGDFVPAGIYFAVFKSNTIIVKKVLVY